MALNIKIAPYPRATIRKSLFEMMISSKFAFHRFAALERWKLSKDVEMIKSLELTLAILKPHVVANPVALADIRQTILREQFKIIRSKQTRLLHEDACRFYEEHRNKFFYRRLVSFMTSGPLDLYVMARHDAIKHWRSVMGPTKVFKTQFSDPDTIRGKYGLSDTRNAAHGSDSPESAKKEIEFFFTDFKIDGWYKYEEKKFHHLENIEFDENKFMHALKQ